ncbi:MAG: TetR/AcrR family transcriptional regulator [Myxococcota bacterium]|nr:TetR/AcrR family transcriptional regulator [Myxococcota bacterium]
MPRPSNSRARRAEIVDGMLTVMATAGYERASIQAIAAAAGLTAGLLHYHFGSKEKILLAVLDTIEEAITARFEQRISPDAPPRVALEAWIDAHLAIDTASDPRLVACWVQIGAAALRMPTIGTRYQELLTTDAARLRSIVAAVLSEDTAAVDDADAITAAILSAVTGAYQLSLGVPELTPPGSAAEMVKRMSVGLLKIR